MTISKAAKIIFGNKSVNATLAFFGLMVCDDCGKIVRYSSDIFCPVCRVVFDVMEAEADLLYAEQDRLLDEEYAIAEAEAMADRESNETDWSLLYA